MAMRLSEFHPSLVHFPIALLPASIAADAVGRSTRNRELLAVGKWCIAGAAVTAAIAGVFGLIAQEEVNVDGEAKKILQTHRTMNVTALAIMTSMALVRASKRRPSTGYLLVGLGTIAAVSVSAYLGGKLVYAHGAGVEKAGGIYGEDPAVTRHKVGRAAKVAIKDLRAGVAHTARDLKDGQIAPLFQRKSRDSGT